MEIVQTIVFARIFVENRQKPLVFQCFSFKKRQKPLVFQCFSSKTAKNRWFFNAFRRKSQKTVVFSMLFVENPQKPLFFQCFSSPDSILEFRNPSETVSIGFPKRVNAYLKRFFIYLKIMKEAVLGNRPKLLFLQ